MPAFGQAADQIVRSPLVVLGHQHAQARIPLSKRQFTSRR
jgi:hypothetical protein